MSLDQEISAVLQRHKAVRIGLLFGSVHRGCASPDSDLDVAVAGQQPLQPEEKWRLIEDLAALCGRPVDLVDLRQAGGSILREALVKGRVIYCHDRILYAELIKRMLFHEADFEPYRRRILAERRRAWTHV